MSDIQTQRKAIGADTFSWYVFFICGIIIPWVVNIILTIAMKGLSINLGNGPVSTLFSVVIDILIFWFGIKYYLNYAQKKYELNNKAKLIKNIVITFSAWSILGLVIYIVVEKPNIMDIILTIIIAIIEIGIFYAASKKYLTIK